jgi:hypothetical protein
MRYSDKYGCSALTSTNGPKSSCKKKTSKVRFDGLDIRHSSLTKVLTSPYIELYIVGGMTLNKGAYERCSMSELMCLDFSDIPSEAKPTK